MKKGYDTVLCTKGGNGFKSGTVYPSMGNINGVKIMCEKENVWGDQEVAIYTATAYGGGIGSDEMEELILTNGTAKFVYITRRIG